jgi:hypothetical protein
MPYWQLTSVSLAEQRGTLFLNNPTAINPIANIAANSNNWAGHYWV